MSRREKTEMQIAELDAAMRRRGWCASMVRTFCARWECKPARVYDIKKRVLDRMRSDDDLELDLRRSLFLAELRAVRQQAREEGRWGPVAQIMKMEAQIQGLFAPVSIEVSANPLHAMSDAELEQILLEEKRTARRRRNKSESVDASFEVVKGGK